MKKWIWLGSLFLLLVLLFSVAHVINDVVKTGQNIDRRIIDQALEKTPLVTVTGTDIYFGTETIPILYGKDEQGREMVVWMKEDGSVLRAEWLEHGVSAEKVASRVESRFDVDKKIHITPGRENGVFLWEAVYRTKGGDYLYAYYDFYTGTFLQSLKVKNPSRK